MAFATLISRITGFLRFVLVAALLGAALSSTFSVANQLPNLIAALVLEATFTAIFVPVLARAERDDPDGGAAFVRRLFTISSAVLLVATTLSVASAPLLVRLMLGDDPQVDAALTTKFAYLLLPQIIFYGLSSVFMAILNTRNVFGPTAWAPVVNNVVGIATLGLFVVVPGEISFDPVAMGEAKLLVLGIGTTLGVVAQTAVVYVAILRQRISLRPLWGIDDRLKQFAMMAAAMVLYVLISQFGLVVANQIAATAAASGPAIYNYTSLVMMLPFGIIGVTVLTIVMPRLSRNAADDDIPAVLADLSLATRLMMVTLIPITAFMTVGGPAIGTALFAYGNFGLTDAGYLGQAIALSAFMLIPYGLVLLQLRVFYARQQAWTPIAIIVVITAVKIVVSLLAPSLTDDPELVAGYLGLANGLGFLAGATVGYVLLRRSLNPPRGQLIQVGVLRTVLVTVAASLLAGLVAFVVDAVAGFDALTRNGGGAGSMLRLVLLALIMAPIIAGVMLAAGVPEAQAALAAVRRRLGRKAPAGASRPAVSDDIRRQRPVTYPDRRPVPPMSSPRAIPGVPPAPVAHPPVRKGMAVSDETASEPTTKIPRASADSFEPDVVAEGPVDTAEMPPPERPAPPRRPPGDFAGDPTRESMGFAIPRETADSSRGGDMLLMAGASIADGRYRLLVPHGGPDHLQFWQALDTALDRQVALTFVDPDGLLEADEVAGILSETMRLSRIGMPGIARVLDVSRVGSGGLVVAEWIRGGSLQEVAETSPSPVGGARAVQSLAAAADAAHQAGLSLSLDHPGRIRVSIEGDVALAFPATMPDASPEADVRGCGAALYALLVNQWPLPESGEPSGMTPADLDPDGQPAEPRSLDHDIPFQISAAAVRSVQESGGIISAATLLNLLQQATAAADRTEVIPPVEESEESVAPVAADPEAQARRRKMLIVGLSAGGAVLVVVLLVLGAFVKSLFPDLTGDIDRGQLGLNPRDGSTTAADQPAGSPVKPTAVTVFSPGGGADKPETAPLAIDGKPTTAWETDTYTDPVPFPNFKSGVGLLLRLPQPTKVTAVTVDVPSTGTSVQIRAAASPTASDLSDTTELTPVTPIKRGPNTIKVDGAAPTSVVLVWITTMGTTEGENRTAFNEVTVQGTV